MRTTTIRALLFSCTGAVLGCSSSGSEDAGAELGVGTGSLALMRLERFASDVEGAEGATRVVANAKVARYSGLDGSSVLKLLGVDLREGDSCSVIGRLDDFPMASDARVQLLSVGDISLRIADRSHTFSPQLFPDLATTASGWFYAGHVDVGPQRVLEPRADGGADRDDYAIAAQGAQGVGRFELSVAAPTEVSGLELGGVSLEVDGAVNRGVDAELTWEPEDLRDRVELEIAAGGSVLSCSVRDDGQFVLGHQKLALLEADPQASLVLRRVRDLSTDMQGIETAYVRIATTRTLSLKVD